MIAINELRIYNWVYVSTHDTWKLVDMIDYNDGEKPISFVHLQGNGLCSRPDQLRGIPIAADVLEKCGFAYDLRDEGYKWLRLTYNNLVFDTDESEGFSKVRLTIRGITLWEGIYLHQLQNIYFALISKELIIK